MAGRAGMLLVATVFALSLPAAVAGGQAEAGPGGGAHDPYSIEDIEHSFAVMEGHVLYDRDKNISFDIANALLDDSVSQTDIDIALDFAAHSNSIMNAAMGPVAQANEGEGGSAELARAVRSLEDGRFRLLFGKDAGPVTASGAAQGLANLALPLSAHEEPGSNAQAARRGGGTSLAACGGGMSDPHPWHSPVPQPPRDQAFPSTVSAHSWALENRYHVVPAYATGHFPKDYARVDASAPGDCNSGQFREQAMMKAKSTGTRFDTQHDEPNPELLSYAWPRLWWGGYTYWWHVTDGGTKS